MKLKIINWWERHETAASRAGRAGKRIAQVVIPTRCKRIDTLVSKGAQGLQALGVFYRLLELAAQLRTGKQDEAGSFLGPTSKHLQMHGIAELIDVDAEMVREALPLLISVGLIADLEPQKNVLTMPVLKAAEGQEWTIDDIAEAMAQRHPSGRSMAIPLLGQVLIGLVEKMANPRKAAEGIDKLHAWKCRFDWTDPKYAPSLSKWLASDDCFAPCPSEEDGLKRVTAPAARMTKEEQLRSMLND